VLEVQPLGDLVDVGDFQHDRRRCLVGASLYFSHECVADATVRFGRDVGQHPCPCRGDVGAMCANLAFATWCEHQCRGGRDRGCGHGDGDLAVCDANEHDGERGNKGRDERQGGARDVAGFGEERDATVGVGDPLVRAEQSQRGRELVLVEPSGMEPRRVREPEWFTRWRGGRSG